MIDIFDLAESIASLSNNEMRGLIGYLANMDNKINPDQMERMVWLYENPKWEMLPIDRCAMRESRYTIKHPETGVVLCSAGDVLSASKVRYMEQEGVDWLDVAKPCPFIG